MTTPSLLSWMWQSTWCLAAGWLLYRLVLRHETCFGYNRRFLLLVPPLAALLPLLPWAGWWPPLLAPPHPVPGFQLPTEPLAPGLRLHWLLLLYGAGVAAGLLRLGWHLGRLWRLNTQLPASAQPGYVLRLTGGRLPTSSFGRTVYWDETTPLSATEAAQLLAHEQAHIRRGHSADQLWLQLCRSLLWFNPFVHLLAADLTLLHEYQADADVLRQLSGTAAGYSRLLARQASRPWRLTQAFAASSTLFRIAMLHRISVTRAWRKWAVLPVAAALLGLLGGTTSVEPPAATPALPASPAKASFSRNLPDFHGSSWRPGETREGC